MLWSVVLGRLRCPVLDIYEQLGMKRVNAAAVFDSRGHIHAGREGLDESKQKYATKTEYANLAEAMKDADVFLGLSKEGLVDADMVKSMAHNPIVFALANPDPEIAYDEAMASREDVIMATGRSDHPNQVNNVLGFPYIFRGGLGRTRYGHQRRHEARCGSCHRLSG